MKQFLEIGFSNRNAVARATDGLVDHGRHVRLAEVFGDIVSQRRSMRDFKSDPVPQEIIEAVFGCAQRAPSNCNTQPWFVHVVTGETLYFAVVPELVPVLPKRDERFRSDACAVVGGSGSLAGSGLGDEIDAHDAVFRIHDAPTQGHEQDVGAKTTFQVLSPFWAGELLKHPEGKGVA